MGVSSTRCRTHLNVKAAREENTVAYNLYIVDDDEAVRMSLGRLLGRQFDSTIYYFTSGDEFLRRCGALEPGVVLLDYHMIGTDGVGVLKQLHEYTERFVVIMLTAHGDVARSVEAMRSGAYDFLEKPYDSSALMMCLDDAVAELRRRRCAIAGRDSARRQLAALSNRETEVLDGLVVGYSNKQIAWALQISPRTIEIYRANMMQKLKARSIAELLQIVFAADTGRAM